jgi:hypothetical protein
VAAQVPGHPALDRSRRDLLARHGPRPPGDDGQYHAPDRSADPVSSPLPVLELTWHVHDSQGIILALA